MTARRFERLVDDLTVSAQEEAIERIERMRSHNTTESRMGLIDRLVVMAANRRLGSAGCSLLGRGHAAVRRLASCQGCAGWAWWRSGMTTVSRTRSAYSSSTGSSVRSQRWTISALVVSAIGEEANPGTTSPRAWARAHSCA